jgi:hypothetical protein
MVVRFNGCFRLLTPSLDSLAHGFELQDYMAIAYADQTRRAVMSCARYAEAFPYDENTGIFSRETRRSQYRLAIMVRLPPDHVGNRLRWQMSAVVFTRLALKIVILLLFATASRPQNYLVIPDL